MQTAEQPKDYFKLPAGTKYVVLMNTAVPIADLTGTVQGSFFYAEGDTVGRFVRTRTETLAEKAKASQPAPAQTKIVLDLSDWK